MEIVKVKMFKLLNNDDVLGKAVRIDGGWELTNPALLGMVQDQRGQPSMGLADYLVLAEGTSKKLTIMDGSILYSYDPKASLIAAYTEMFSGLAIPQKPSLILEGARK